MIFVKWLLGDPALHRARRSWDRGVRRRSSSPSSRSCSRGVIRAACSTSWSERCAGAVRVNAYAHWLMTDRYPPFSLKMSQDARRARSLWFGRPAWPHLQQAISDDGGPTPLPPAVSQVMAEPILYHRAPAFIEIYARVLERLKMVFQTAERGAAVRRLGHGRAGVGGREPDRARRRRRGRLLREVRAALGGAVRRLRRRDRAPRDRVGREGRSRRASTGAGRARAAGSRPLHHPVRDLDRRR